MSSRSPLVARPPDSIGLRRIELIEWLAVAMTSALVIGCLYAWGTERAGLFKDDTVHYGRLAENLAAPVRLPYTFRLLTPWLVSLLPMDTASSFTTITLVSLIATATLLYAFMAHLGYERRARAGALAVFLGSSVVIRMLTTPTYVDSLTYLLTIASFVALALGRDWLFCVLATIGVLNRETALILLPAYLVARWPHDQVGWARVIVVCLVPVAVLTAVVTGKMAVLNILSSGIEGLRSLNYTGYVQRVPRVGDLLDAFSLFGIAWLALLLGWRTVPRWLACYGVLVIAQLLVSRGDESRNLSHLFPLVIPLVAGVLTQAWRLGAVVAVALTICMILSMVHYRWAWISLDWLRYGLIAAGTVGGLALLFWMRRRLAHYREPTDGMAGAGASSAV